MLAFSICCEHTFFGHPKKKENTEGKKWKNSQIRIEELGRKKHRNEEPEELPVKDQRSWKHKKGRTRRTFNGLHAVIPNHLFCAHTCFNNEFLLAQ
jgi:hypothetical protein